MSLAHIEIGKFVIFQIMPFRIFFVADLGGFVFVRSKLGVCQRTHGQKHHRDNHGAKDIPAKKHFHNHMRNLSAYRAAKLELLM